MDLIEGSLNGSSLYQKNLSYLFIYSHSSFFLSNSSSFYFFSNNNLSYSSLDTSSSNPFFLSFAGGGPPFLPLSYSYSNFSSSVISLGQTLRF